MDSAELGRRLKSARLARKMTQSDVAGNFITRNMLSLIESGSATPSMKTLEYLAGVLEIPMERLVSESGEPERQNCAMVELQHAKKLLSEQNYQAVLDTIQPQPAIMDEIHAIRSIAHLELARQLAESGQTEQLQAAISHANLACTEASVGIYANAARISQANQLIAQIASYLSNYYSALAQATPEC